MTFRSLPLSWVRAGLMAATLSLSIPAAVAFTSAFKSALASLTAVTAAAGAAAAVEALAAVAATAGAVTAVAGKAGAWAKAAAAKKPATRVASSLFMIKTLSSGFQSNTLLNLQLQRPLRQS